MLIGYAAGSAEPSSDLVVATHLALCPACRRAIADLEAVGGELLAALPPPAPISGLDAVLARIADPPPPPVLPRGGDPRIPEPLRSLVGPFAAAPWLEGEGGLRAIDLPLGGRFAILPAGSSVPYHTHSGRELVLVLTGAFEDGRADYRRGDVSVADPTVFHDMRILPDEPCIALVVREGPVLGLSADGTVAGPLPGY
jgi:putative transcriptional regulator